MITALILVDLQNDFCPGGALAVNEGDQIIGPANELVRYATKHAYPIVCTRDWHPANHYSFKEHGGIWPEHCVAGSHGARFHPALDLPDNVSVVSTADTPDKEAYSGFEGTALAEQLNSGEVEHLIVAGLATDYCVKHTVLDGLSNGFRVRVVNNAIRAVNVEEGDGTRAIEEMRGHGAVFAELADVIG